MQNPGGRITGINEIICFLCNDDADVSVIEKLNAYRVNNGLLSTLVLELREKNDILQDKIELLEEKLTLTDENEKLKKKSVSKVIICDNSRPSKSKQTKEISEPNNSAVPEPKIDNLIQNIDISEKTSSLSEQTSTTNISSTGPKPIPNITSNTAKTNPNNQKCQTQVNKNKNKTVLNAPKPQENGNDLDRLPTVSDTTGKRVSSKLSQKETNSTNTQKGVENQAVTNNHGVISEGEGTGVTFDTLASTSNQVAGGNVIKTNTENLENWTLVKSRKNRTNLSKRPDPIIGVNKNAGILQAAKLMHWVFLSGFSRSTVAENILNFLKDQQLGEGCVCEEMRTKSKQVKSFKLGVPQGVKQQILDAGLWPEGIKVNHFRNL